MDATQAMWVQLLLLLLLCPASHTVTLLTEDADATVFDSTIQNSDYVLALLREWSFSYAICSHTAYLQSYTCILA